MNTDPVITVLYPGQVAVDSDLILGYTLLWEEIHPGEDVST